MKHLIAVVLFAVVLTPSAVGADPRPVEGTGAEAFYTAPPATPREQRFLACLRRGESRNNYWSVSRTGKFRGAFQFSQGTWNGVMIRYGLPVYVDVPPEWGHPTVQDRAALLLYRERGWKPWPTIGRRCAR